MNILKDAIKTIIVSLVIISFVGIVYAWSEPTSNPPSGNVSAPINTGSIEQIKSGNLIINGSIKSTSGGAYGQGVLNFDYHSLNSNSNGWLYLGDQNNSVYGGRGLAADYFWANTRIYTPIIYDANNIGYYIDPASSSKLGGNLSVGGSVTASNVTASGQNVCRQNGVNCPASASIGSGTTNYISKWTSGSTLGNSTIYDNGTNVGIGTTAPASKLDVNGSASITPASGDTFSVNSESSRPMVRISDSGAGNPVLQFGRSGDYINLEYDGSYLAFTNDGVAFKETGYYYVGVDNNGTTDPDCWLDGGAGAGTGWGGYDKSQSGCADSSISYKQSALGLPNMTKTSYSDTGGAASYEDSSSDRIKVEYETWHYYGGYKGEE